MHVLAILYRGGGAVQAHKAKGVGSSSKGVGTRNARGWCYDQIGWVHGVGHVGH